MAFLIYAIDNEGMESLRESLRESHRNHLKSVGSKLISSGALLSEKKKNSRRGRNQRHDWQKQDRQDYRVHTVFKKRLCLAVQDFEQS